jgi:hypothetical protein
MLLIIIIIPLYRLKYIRFSKKLERTLHMSSNVLITNMCILQQYYVKYTL